jgi:hypothetical protein
VETPFLGKMSDKGKGNSDERVRREGGKRERRVFSPLRRVFSPQRRVYSPLPLPSLPPFSPL